MILVALLTTNGVRVLAFGSAADRAGSRFSCILLERHNLIEYDVVIGTISIHGLAARVSVMLCNISQRCLQMGRYEASVNGVITYEVCHA